ncbi:MAG: glycosyltransferase family 2 protein [Flavobacteriales bacterium]
MNKNPKISIITVTFNGEKTIKDTIKSVFSQDYNNIEHIIIDGKSTDRTIDIVKSYGDKISHFISEQDDGIYDAMNKGIRVATGDIIGVLNSDDFYPCNHIISDVVKKFNDHDTDSIYGDLVYVDTEQTYKVTRYWQSKYFSMHKMRRGWTLPHPTFFVKKKVYDEFGLYSIRLKSAADYEMIIRLLYKNKISVQYLPEILVRMRNGGVSNASIWNRLRGNNEDYIAWKMNGFYPPLFIRIRKPLSKLSQFFKRPNNDA